MARRNLRPTALGDSSLQEKEAKKPLRLLNSSKIEQPQVCLREWKCCQFKTLPNWLQDNQFLISGHRPPLPSVRECCKSIFRIHTETINIWSHLLGALAFIGEAIHFMNQEKIPLEQKLVISVFFFGAVTCFSLSATFHAIHCHSESVCKLFSKLDYVGISTLSMGSFFPWLYYGFNCDTWSQMVYWSVTFFLGLATIVASLSDKFGTPRWRPIRASIFAGFGLSGVIPAIHYISVRGFIRAFTIDPFGWLLLMAVLYILGVLFYSSRIPERWYKGKCDIMGQSHQIFHILVVAGTYANYHGVLQLAKLRGADGFCEGIEI
ncbi:adiponectin receptor protein [Folsomia candida]|uniref:Adiponectin receptor protein n=1 Tax=Folsomia candida TaxID=158441 RepID=A0A226ETP2_FOLCA|nr:adiponectin receptor protein [Folsomia candida]OXA60600.1 Adiponectin receptor protein [Folsomia candida]